MPLKLLYLLQNTQIYIKRTIVWRTYLPRDVPDSNLKNIDAGILVSD